MKFAVVVLLLVIVVCAHGQSSAKGATGVKGAQGSGNLSPSDIAEIQNGLTLIVGPRLSKLLTNVFVLLANGLTAGLPLKGVAHLVVQLMLKVLAANGIAEQVATGFNSDPRTKSNYQSDGKPKNLPPAEQQRLIDILKRTFGVYLATYMVRVVNNLFNGLLAKIPLKQPLSALINLTDKLLDPQGLIGTIVGQKGLGKPISQIFGEPGDILGLIDL